MGGGARAARGRAQCDAMTTEPELLVETRGLTKHYGSIVAVDHLDLKVRRGEVYGFLGPNGAGKTTTLRMLLGLIRPTAGSATVAGHPPGEPRGLARLGAIVESPAFYPYLSGRENLRVIADYCGAPDQRIDEVLETVELAPRARSRYSTYSLGMKQRLGVAAALLKDPELLVLDEPTNGLDPQGMVDMRNLIVELGGGNRTVLVSSHLLGEVEQMCSRIGVIRKGRLVAEGSIAELRGESGLFIRAYPADRARAVLVEAVGADAVQLDGSAGGFAVRTGPERAPELNWRLVSAGVGVMELRPRERSLEDVFLELTGGEAGL